MVRTDDTGAFSLENAEGSFVHVDASGKQTELPYKVSGPDFYKLSDGRLSMPLGTYTIQEVKAPEGYRLDAARASHQRRRRHERDRELL